MVKSGRNHLLFLSPLHFKKILSPFGRFYKNIQLFTPIPESFIFYGTFTGRDFAETFFS